MIDGGTHVCRRERGGCEVIRLLEPRTASRLGLTPTERGGTGGPVEGQLGSLRCIVQKMRRCLGNDALTLAQPEKKMGDGRIVSA